MTISHSTTARPGYIFLVSVLAIGAIAVSTAVSLVLLGLAASQSGFSVAQSAQAYENAHTCVERALRLLREDVSYGGEERFVLADGECALAPIGGSGNNERTICAEGTFRDLTRRMQVRVRSLFPSVRIAAWEETGSFTFCP